MRLCYLGRSSKTWVTTSCSNRLPPQGILETLEHGTWLRAQEGEVSLPRPRCSACVEPIKANEILVRAHKVLSAACQGTIVCSLASRGRIMAVDRRGGLERVYSFDESEPPISGAHD